MNDLISVIVPVYNIEQYIEKCIQSISQQSYINLEVIIVNDGSTDQSGNICEKMAKMDARIRIIHQKNAGLAEARNTGLKATQGQYIVFVDGDDYIEKDMIESLYQRIKQDHSDFVLCNIHYVDEDGRYIKSKEENLEDSLLCQKEFWKEYYEKVETPYVVSWNKLYKKELFEHTFFEKNKIHEDEFILHKIVSQCRTISVVKDKLYNYVQRDNSIMNRSYNIKRLHVFEALNIRLNYFDISDQEYINPTINYMLKVLLDASLFLDLSNPDDKCKLEEYIQIYKKRFFQYYKNMSIRSVVKSVVFLYARPIYLLLKGKMYINE